MDRLPPARQWEAMRLLAGDATASRSAAAQIASGGDWPAVVELSRAWKMLPALQTRLCELGVELDAADQVRLSQTAASLFVQTNLCLRAGRMALEVLEKHSIRCAGFKGLATMAHLYRSPRERMLQDVDILVAPADAEAAVKVLEENGFQRSIKLSWAEYLSFVRKAPGSAGNEAVSFSNARGGAIDLHWRLGVIDHDTLFAGVRRVPLQAGNAPVVSPAASMLFCVHHAVRNDFAPGEIARDVLDFKRWQSLLEGSRETEALQAESERWGLKHAVLAMAEIVSAFQYEEVARARPGVSQKDCRIAQQLAELYLSQLREGALNTDLVYLGSHRPARQVASGLAGGWRSYLGAMRQSEAVNGELSQPVWKRLAKLAGSAKGLSFEQWRQIRALARTKDRVSGTNRRSGKLPQR
jgi:hypothetical protein